MNKTADSKVTFKFLEAKLFVKRIRVDPELLSAQNTTLKEGGIARYNLTRVELKTFAFPAGLTSLSMDNAVLDSIPKRLLFTMVKNTDFLGSLDTNPYNFRHYILSSFVMFVNGKQFPNEGLSLDMCHEKSSVMGYRTLFDRSGIHHSNAGLQITHDMYISGFLCYFLISHLTTERQKDIHHIWIMSILGSNCTLPRHYLTGLLVCCTWNMTIVFV
jgi:hypothetical protein